MTLQQWNQSIPYPQLHDLEQERRKQDQGVWGSRTNHCVCVGGGGIDHWKSRLGFGEP
jgi:hypothetical protein